MKRIKCANLTFVLISILCIGTTVLFGCDSDLDTIGGDDDSSKGYVTFYNYVECADGTLVEAKLTISGREILANSGQGIGCIEFDPGVYPANIYVSACGETLDEDFTIYINEDYDRVITLQTMEGGGIDFKQSEDRPGDCHED